MHLLLRKILIVASTYLKLKRSFLVDFVFVFSIIVIVFFLFLASIDYFLTLII